MPHRAARFAGQVRRGFAWFGTFAGLGRACGFLGTPATRLGFGWMAKFRIPDRHIRPGPGRDPGRHPGNRDLGRDQAKRTLGGRKHGDRQHHLEMTREASGNTRTREWYEYGTKFSTNTPNLVRSKDSQRILFVARTAMPNSRPESTSLYHGSIPSFWNTCGACATADHSCRPRPRKFHPDATRSQCSAFGSLERSDQPIDAPDSEYGFHPTRELPGETPPAQPWHQ